MGNGERDIRRPTRQFLRYLIAMEHVQAIMPCASWPDQGSPLYDPCESKPAVSAAGSSRRLSSVPGSRP